jgi:beta-phosphoglucomutase-like phosphatase (HAD superfamily)
MLASVFAFDGVLASTLPLRSHALVDAAAAEQAQLDVGAVLALLPGRTLLEASLALFPELALSDPTLPELIALRAQRGFRALVQHGVPLDQRALLRLQDAATRGDRIVVRADSERRDVESLLALAGLENSVSLLRCSDDAPRAPGASLQRSWEAIHTRLSPMGVSLTQRTAFETNSETAETAALFVQASHVW